MWDKIRMATDWILDHRLNSATLSREAYDRMKGMFQYYVPLRGFAEDTAEDLYEYYNRDASNDFSPLMATAKGRKSIADNPLAQIGVMAESAIQQDNKNKAKLTLYYFLMNRPDNGLVTVSETWQELQGTDPATGKTIWKEVQPDFSDVKDKNSAEEISEAVRMFVEKMQDLQKLGRARKGHNRLSLDETVVHISDKSAAEHSIPVMVNGRRINLIINGSPRAAQAINGLLNIEQDDDIIKGTLAKATRWMSANFTSRNPEFWISNMQRDMLFAYMNISIKENDAYRKVFERNLKHGFKSIVYTRRNTKDTLGDSKYEKYYREFVKNGGVTGYTRLANADEYKDMMEKFLKRQDEKKLAKGIREGFEMLKDFSEGIENVMRFAAYITSREQGRTVARSVMDAKNISVNFNRKGSGKAISWEESANLTLNGKQLTKAQRIFFVTVSGLAPALRSTVAFFNASVQSLSLAVTLARTNPRKFAAWMTGAFALGMLNAMLHALLDDDDDYLDMPDYERHQNFLLGAKGFYLKWNLPQEARPFYAMGDIAVNFALGRMKHKDVFWEAMKAAWEVAPPVTPTGLQPLFEIAVNENYFGAPVYKDGPWTKNDPAYQRVYRNTGWLYVDMSEALNTITGGDYATPGWIGNGFLANPAAWQHLVEGYTGGTGQFINKVMNLGPSLWGLAVDGEEWSWRNTPLFNRIIVSNDDRTRNSYLNDVYWYYRDIAEQTRKREKAYLKNRDSEKRLELRLSPDYMIMRIFDRYEKKIEKYDDMAAAETDERRRKEILEQKDRYVLRPMAEELMKADR